MNRYGFYILSHTDRVLAAIAAKRPAWVVLHDGEVKRENIDAIRQASPGTKIACRWYREDSWFEQQIRSNPDYAADVVATNIEATGLAADADAWITTNEIMQGWDDIVLLNNFYVELQRIFPHPLFLGSFSVKQPGDAGDPFGVKHIERFYPAMRGGLSHGDYLAWHGYAKPRLFNGDMAFLDTDLDGIVRWQEYIWPSLPDDLKALPMVVSEFGWDHLIGHPPPSEKGGWLHPLSSESTQDAAQQLFDFMALHDERYAHLHIPIDGWIIYGAGDSGGWSCYDVTTTSANGCATREAPLIDSIPLIPITPPEPPQPPPEEPMLPDYVQIFDAAGNPQSKEWLVEKYGNVSVVANQAEDSFRLARIDESTNGESAIKVRVLDADGQPARNNVAFHWPDAPEQVEGCATQPSNEFIWQSTDSQGYTAFAMGTGSYYWPPEVGIHKVWLCSSLESDVVDGLGMLSGTNHHHLDLTFVRYVVAPDPDPDPDPEPEPEPGQPANCDAVAAVAIAAIMALDNANQRLASVIDALLKEVLDART